MKLIVHRVFIILLALNFFFGTAFAENTPVLKQSKIPPKALISDPVSGGEIVQVVIGLLLVLGSIVLLVWLMKKMGRFNLIKNDKLQIIAALNLGAREKVIVVQVGDEQILIGATPTAINKLHVLETPLDLSTQNENFSTTLSEKIKNIIIKKKELR